MFAPGKKLLKKKSPKKKPAKKSPKKKPAKKSPKKKPANKDKAKEKLDKQLIDKTLKLMSWVKKNGYDQKVIINLVKNN